MVATIIWLTVTEYHKWQRIYSVCPHVEQEVPTLPEHFSSPPDVHGVRVVPSLVFCVIFCRSFFFPFVLFHLAIVLSDLRLLIYGFWFTASDLRLLIYDFWLPFWYLPSFLMTVCYVSDIINVVFHVIWITYLPSKYVTFWNIY